MIDNPYGLRPQGLRLAQRLKLGNAYGGVTGAVGPRPHAAGTLGAPTDVATKLNNPMGVTNQAAAPSQPAAVTGGMTNGAPAVSAGQAGPANPIDDLTFDGKGSGFKGIRKRLMQQGYANAQWANPMLRGSLVDLLNQANTDHFSQEGRAAFLAPRLEVMNHAVDAARGRMVSDQSARGLDDSSYGAAASGALDQAAAASRARLVGDLYQSEEQRQLQAQAQLRAALQAYQSGNANQASQIAANIAQWQAQMAQAEAQAGNWYDPLMQLAVTGAQVAKYV